MSELTMLIVDAFTDRPYAGNPAAVCLLDGEREAEWLQAVAAEMNLSETAFVRRVADDYELRWFTPAVEVDLCGHATLASAHVLWEQGLVAPGEPVRFRTLSGVLTCRQRGGGIELDFPATPVGPAEATEGLADALGTTPAFVGRSAFDVLVQVDDEATLRALTPDFRALARVDARGIIVTSASDDARYDFVSRFFGPAAGIDEDPVTGSAHCALAPFWGERLGRTEMVALQASPRTGVVRVQLAGERVLLTGQAVTVLRGALTSDAAARPQGIARAGAVNAS